MIYFLCAMTALGFLASAVQSARGNHARATVLTYQTVAMFTITTIYAMTVEPDGKCFYF